MLELRTLMYLHTVVQLGSISKAAVALHMTQPTLSRQISHLERTLGCALLTRTSRGAEATPAGELLTEQTKKIFALTDQIPEILGAAESGRRVITTGMPPGVPREWFETFRAGLSHAHPSLRLALREATSREQHAMLLSGVLDIGLLHYEPQHLESRCILEQQLGCAIRSPHMLTQHLSLRLADLGGFRVLAHSGDETPGEEARLRALTESRGARIEWTFSRFSEYGELIAQSSDVDAVMVTAASAKRHFSAWRWIPLESSEIVVQTWAAWSTPDLARIEPILHAMKTASEGLGALVETDVPD